MRNAVTTTSLLGLATLGLLAGCPDRTISEVSPEQGRVEFKDIPVNINRRIDVLFVIDNSPSMLDKQNNLKSNFPNFINVLNTIQGGLPDVHLGVVTSDMGTKGAEDSTAGPGIGSGPGACAGTGDSGNLQTNGSSLVMGTFINDQSNGDGTRTSNYVGDLPSAFSSIASVGVDGCGFEQHLESAKRALNSNSFNSGFMRPEAYLALIFIQDEDDCSLAHSSLLANDSSLGPLQSFRCNRYGHVCDPDGNTPDEMNNVGPKGVVNGVSGVGCSSNENGQYLTKVGDYVSFFKGLKSEPSNVIVAGIAGPATPYEVELRPPPGGGDPIRAVAHSCSYVGSDNSTQVADPSTRLLEFLAQFPNRNTIHTNCTPDLSPALTQIAQLLRTVIGSPCIEGNLADVDPNTPGDQYDCSVSDVHNFGQADQDETILPQCNNLTDPENAATNKPCWAIVPDPVNCMTSPNLTLKVFRETNPPTDTHVVSYCVTKA
jgi:hypothetical protein